MPFPGPWQTAPFHPAIVATVTDYVEENFFAWQNAGRRDENSAEPTSSFFDYDPALSFTKAAHGTDPLLLEAGSAGFAGVASVWGMREAWRGDVAEWAATASRLGIDWAPVNNHVYRYNPPIWPTDALDIEYEYAPGTGVAEDGAANHLYMPSGVTNVRIAIDGFVANLGGAGAPVHGFDANLEVRLAPGNPTFVTTSTGFDSILPDFTLPTTQLTPEQLTAAELLASIPLPSIGDSVYDPDAGNWVSVNDNPTLDVAFTLPDAALPRALRLDNQEPAVEVYFAVDHHRSDTAPPVGALLQTPTFPHGPDNEEYNFSEYWITGVAMSGALIDASGLTIRAIYHLTFDFQPARYRFLYNAPQTDLAGAPSAAHAYFSKGRAE